MLAERLEVNDSEFQTMPVCVWWTTSHGDSQRRKPEEPLASRRLSPSAGGLTRLRPSAGGLTRLSPSAGGTYSFKPLRWGTYPFKPLRWGTYPFKPLRWGDLL